VDELSGVVTGAAVSEVELLVQALNKRVAIAIPEAAPKTLFFMRKDYPLLR